MTPERHAFLTAAREIDPEGRLTTHATMEHPTLGPLWAAHLARIYSPPPKPPAQLELDL